MSKAEMIACASVNYRLAQEAAFPAAVEDCKAAVRYLRANADKYGYKADQITVFGESAGGYLALMCAVTGDDEFSSVPFIGQTDSDNPSSKVDVLVDYYGYTDITGLDKDLKSIGLPRIVYTVANYWMIHGDCDLTIPYLSSVRLYNRLSEVIGQDGIHFRHEPDMGHASDPLYSDEILSEIDDFIRGDLS